MEDNKGVAEMKPFTRFLAALLAMLLCLSGLAAFAESKVKTTGKLNLRTGAGLAYSSVGIVPKDVTVSYDSAATDDRGVVWYHVTYDGKSGWISSIYAKPEGGSPATTVKTTGSVHLRSGAGLSFASLDVIAKGTSLVYDSSAADGRGVVWYHVSYNGKTGWVSSMYAKKDDGGSSTKTVKTTASLNLRAGAGLSFAVLRTVPKDVSFTYDSSAADSRGVVWYHVVYKGTAGWISSVYAKQSGDSSYTTAKATANVNLRKDAGVAYKSLGIVPKGKTAVYLGQSKTDSNGVIWYRITYKSTTGWVCSKYVKLS